MISRISHPSLSCAVLALIISGSSQLGAATLTGLWEFDNGASLGQATVGSDLVFEGAAPTYSASIADDGATSLSGVMTTAAALAENRIGADHGIAANGGGSFVNQYSIVADIFSPVASRGAWRTIYQTSTTNGNDADFFIRNSDDNIGVAELTYGPAINETSWIRLVVTVDLTQAGNDVLTYIDGSLHYAHTADPGVDGRFSLDPSLFFFTDNDGDNAPLNVGALGIFEGVLTAGEVAGLGGAGSAIPEPSAFALLALAVGLVGGRRRR